MDLGAPVQHGQIRPPNAAPAACAHQTQEMDYQAVSRRTQKNLSLASMKEAM